MQQINISDNKSIKDCLKDRYIGANLATQVALEKNRLLFLQRSMLFKRPPQSLRVRGLHGLSDERGRLLVQEIESKALTCAIEEKKKLLCDLEEKLRSGNEQMDIDRGLVILNKRKLKKKIVFFRSCEDTKWKDWNRKLIDYVEHKAKSQCVASIKKLKRKLRAQRRKLFKKRENLINAAHYAIENKLVRNLTDVEVPPFSIAVLSYGPGWIPTPVFNKNQYKIDALNAANKQVWSAIFKDSPENVENDVPLSLLKNSVTSSAPLVKDFVVNKAKEAISNFASNLSPPKCKSTLNIFELQGLQWLQNAVKTEKIAVTQADKGGCILIVDPKLIVSSTEEKFMDASRYKCLGSTNPLPEYRKELLVMWKFAVLKEYVSDVQARKTVGLFYKPEPNKSNPFTLSTSDKFKPGIPYPYPLFKVHKLSPAQLDDRNVRPPVRLVTDLHDGVTSRSDKFLVWKWLAPLCSDYASDLVKDSTEALLKLDEFEKKGNISDSTLVFGFDAVSLYDSLMIFPP